MITDLLENPSHLHAAIVHFPIALAIIAFIFLGVSAFFRAHLILRLCTAVLYLSTAVAAWVAERTGERAGRLVPPDFPAAIWDHLEQHETLASYVAPLALGIAVLLFLSFLPRRPIEEFFLLTAGCAGFSLMVLLAFVAHHGGTLVYVHGVGTVPGLREWERLRGESTRRATPPPSPPQVNESPTQTETPPPTPPSVVAPSSGHDSGVSVAPSPQGEHNPAPATPLNPSEVTQPSVPQTVTPNTAVIPPGATLDPQAAGVAGGDGKISVVPFTHEDDPAVLQAKAYLGSPVDVERAKAIRFNEHVRPILEKYCWDCHEAPDAEAGLDLTSREGMLKGGEKAGPSIVPGHPEESPLLEYILGIKRPRMPKKKPPLDPEIIETLRLWIAAGAPINP